MSKFDLRDISQRLSDSKDTEALVFEFLGYLQTQRADWRASLAFYEVSRDALVSLYQRHGQRLVRRDIAVPVDRLPARLVRKFFHPSAFFNATSRRSLLATLFRASPLYEPEPAEAPALRPIAPLADWESCLCMPVADQEDLLALLVLVSPNRGAFKGSAINDLVAVRGMAALALAQHLYRTARPPERAALPVAGGATGSGARSAAPTDEESASRATAEDFRERIERITNRTAAQASDNERQAARLAALTEEIERVDRDSSRHRQELERVKLHLAALEEQSAAATAHLREAQAQLAATQDRMADLRRTVGFLKDVFQLLAEEHDARELPATMVAWFCQHFGIERCSLMALEPGRETLRIAAQQGIAQEIANRARVRVGQGIAGWVAFSRKPLLVRVRSEAGEVQPTGQDDYNSDSFVVVPLIHRDRLVGVLNLSNKGGGLPFDELDLDRATLTGSLLAMTLGAQQATRGAAWA